MAQVVEPAAAHLFEDDHVALDLVAGFVRRLERIDTEDLSHERRMMSVVLDQVAKVRSREIEQRVLLAARPRLAHLFEHETAVSTDEELALALAARRRPGRAAGERFDEAANVKLALQMHARFFRQTA